MKKFLTLMLTAIMAVACCIGLTACSDDSDKLKVGLICLHGESSTYDKNFIDAFKAACANKGVDYLIETDVAEEEACYSKAKDLAEQGCDIIFADSFGHESFIIQAAKEYPDVEFCHATGVKAHTEDVANYHNAFANIYEGRFVAGVAAGLKLAEMKAANANMATKVGYVGAYPYAEVKSGYTSWFLGVQQGYVRGMYDRLGVAAALLVKPSDVTMEVKFTYSWYDENAEKLAAQELISKGAVLISQHADSMGAPTACEDANVPNVSYNGSTAASCPNTFIVSSRINWQPYYEYVIDCVVNDKDIVDDYTAGFGTLYASEQGSVMLTEVGKAATEGTESLLIDVIQAIQCDNLKVFDTSSFTVDATKYAGLIEAGLLTLDEDGHVLSYKADVDDAGDFVGETEAIKSVVIDGTTISYFAESEYRSAPYFDLDIVGITLINPTQD